MTRIRDAAALLALVLFFAAVRVWAPEIAGWVR